MAEDVKKLIAQSKDTTMIIGVGKRRSAVKKLGEIGTAEVVVPLVEALDDEDAEVKKNAFIALSNLRDPVAQEVLRNVYLRSRKKALWQIINKNQMFPQTIAEKFAFFNSVGNKDEILKMVNEQNFEEIVDLIINSEIEKPSDIILLILEKGGENVQMNLIKKFVETKNEALFEVIDRKEWYPPELDKKLMFLLKTERFKKVNDLLDGADFEQVLGILVDPKFPMKKQAVTALAETQNPIIIDEICQVFLKDGNPYLGQIITQNNWSPNNPRDKIFFYLTTDFLKGFFTTKKYDPMLLAGYLDVPFIKRELTKEDYVTLSNFLSLVAATLTSEEKVPIEEENPLSDIYNSVRKFVDQPRTAAEIKEICNEYFETGSRFLEYLLTQKGWAPESVEDQVELYLRTNQDKKLKQLNELSVKPLFELIKGKPGRESLKEKARNTLKSFKNPKALNQVFIIYFMTMDPELDRIIKENDWKPSNRRDKAIFFIMTGHPEKYKEIEAEGFNVIFEAYQSMDFNQRCSLVENIIKARGESMIGFLLQLFDYEKCVKVLRVLSLAVIELFDQMYNPMLEMIPKLDGTALQEIIKALALMKKEKGYKFLYQIARIKKGFTCFWILKILEEARWQPTDPLEINFYYELFKIRDEMLRIVQNRLVDSDPQIRANAAYVLPEMGDERMISVLLRYVNDPVDEVKIAVAYALGRLTALAPQKAIEQFVSCSIGDIFMIFSDVRKAFMLDIDQEQHYILTRNYEGGILVLRAFCIAAMEGMKKPESVPTLIKALNDENHSIRMFALNSLCTILDPSSKDALYRLLEDKDPQVRSMAAEALGKIADHEITEKVMKKFNSGDYSYADGYITAFGFREPEKYRDILERIIQRPDFGAAGKGASVVALSKIKDQNLTNFLIGQLKNIQITSDKLEDIVPYIKAFGNIANVSVYYPLEELIRSGTWEIRKEAVRAIKNIPDRAAMVALIKTLEDQNGWVQIEAIDALNYFYNLHFKFQETEKDLKFVAAIIGRLKKFSLTDVADKKFPEYRVLTQLNITLLQNDLSRLYIKHRDKLTSSVSSE